MLRHIKMNYAPLMNRVIAFSHVPYYLKNLREFVTHSDSVLLTYHKCFNLNNVLSQKEICCP